VCRRNNKRHSQLIVTPDSRTADNISRLDTSLGERLRFRWRLSGRREITTNASKISVVFALLLSGTFSILALSSPVKSLPTDPRFTVCSVTGGDVGTAGSKVCQVALAKYETELPPLLLPHWTFLTYLDLSVSFLTLSIFFLLAPLLTRRWPKGRVIATPRAVKDAALLAMMAGTVVFAVCVFMDVVSTNPADIPGPLFLGNQLSTGWTYYLNRYLLSGQSSLEVFGRTAFFALALAMFGAFVYRLGEGIPLALAKTSAMFAAPLLVVLETVLLVFTPVNMPIHVSALLVGTPLEGVLTNWFVLIVSLGVFSFWSLRTRLSPGETLKTA